MKVCAVTTWVLSHQQCISICLVWLKFHKWLLKSSIYPVCLKEWWEVEVCAVTTWVLVRVLASRPLLDYVSSSSHQDAHIACLDLNIGFPTFPNLKTYFDTLTLLRAILTPKNRAFPAFHFFVLSNSEINCRREDPLWNVLELRIVSVTGGGCLNTVGDSQRWAPI